jgi:hypothetical protein
MTRDILEAVIACHDPERPLERVVTSILEQQGSLHALGAGLKVTVVAHNVGADELAEALTAPVAEQVNFLELKDGIFSPAGPINLGLHSSASTWVTTVGSDDTLARGSLAAWYRRGRRTGAASVLAPIRLPHGMVRTPYLRPGRREVLDPVGDRLAYRTAPLGLLRVDALQAVGFAYTEAGLRAGSDIEPGLRMWFRGGAVTYPFGAPAYVVSEEMGGERVTAAVGRLRSELGWFAPLMAQDWLQDASSAERQEIATKIARAHLVPAVRRRVGDLSTSTAETAPEARDRWTGDDAQTMRAALTSLRTLVGAPLHTLSRAEVRLLTAASEATDTAGAAAAWSAYLTGPPSGRVLPIRLRDVLRPSARPRLLLEQQLVQRGGAFDHPDPDHS